MAVMHRRDNKTEFQLKPTNQQRSRRSCDKSRGHNLVSSATPRCTFSLTAAMLYITAVQRLRELILAVTNLAVIKTWTRSQIVDTPYSTHCKNYTCFVSEESWVKGAPSSGSTATQLKAFSFFIFHSCFSVNPCFGGLK